ncbi:hypothetical protein LF63_0112580 [Oleiagrimonas soli]|uniref:Uncharacterized protein n=1 Tax=Oleiagrimonas soli TaxID=1543381 RepID=A0A099CU04_9GAMM|nr:hypothetical protein LF63_0112580 [Oleiagrimonas soli]
MHRATGIERIIAAALDQHCRHRPEQRHLGELFLHEQKLTRLIDLQEIHVPLRIDNQIGTADNDTQLLHEPTDALLPYGWQLHGLHAGLACEDLLTPVQIGAPGLLEHAHRKNPVADHGHANVLGLVDVTLEDARAHGNGRFGQFRIHIEQGHTQVIQLALGTAQPTVRVERFVDHLPPALDQPCNILGMIGHHHVGKRNIQLDRCLQLHELALGHIGRDRIIDPECIQNLPPQIEEILLEELPLDPEEFTIRLHALLGLGRLRPPEPD